MVRLSWAVGKLSQLHMLEGPGVKHAGLPVRSTEQMWRWVKAKQSSSLLQRSVGSWRLCCKNLIQQPSSSSEVARGRSLSRVQTSQTWSHSLSLTCDPQKATELKYASGGWLGYHTLEGQLRLQPASTQSCSE